MEAEQASKACGGPTGSCGNGRPLAQPTMPQKSSRNQHSGHARKSLRASERGWANSVPFRCLLCLPANSLLLRFCMKSGLVAFMQTGQFMQNTGEAPPDAPAEIMPAAAYDFMARAQRSGDNGTGERCLRFVTAPILPLRRRKLPPSKRCGLEGTKKV